MITNNKLFFYLKLFLSFVVVYFFCSFLIKEVFLANSPKIRPDVGSYLIAKIKNTVSNSKLASLFQKNTNNQQMTKGGINVANLNLIPIAKGVSAYTESGVTHRVYKLDEIEWEEIKYTLKNGKQVTLKIPKGQEPLSQESMEAMSQ